MDNIEILRDIPAYCEAMRRLVLHDAGTALLEAGELVQAGFVVVQVRGAASVVWQRAGEYYTTEEALLVVREGGG